MVWPKRSIASLNVSAIGIGGAHWSLWSDHNDEQSIQVINAAIDAGVNFIDTAFRYTPVGKDQHNELLVARALKERGWKSQVEPSEIVVATKGGHFGYGEEGFVDGRPETIERHLEASLRALEVEQIQLYYLHWPDPNVPIGESIATLEKARQAGKILHIGVSNFDRIQLDQALEVAPIAAVQNKFNPGHQHDRDLIDYCQQRAIAYVPYSPLGGTFPPTPIKPTHPELVDIASDAAVSVPVLILNWHLSLSPNIIPLVGSRHPNSVIDSAKVMTANLPAEITERVSKLLSHGMH